MTWEDIGNRAQAKVWDSIPAEWLIPDDKMPTESEADVTTFPYKSGMLTEHEIAITNALASDIVQQVAQGKWKAEGVARAFCKRAAIAHQLTNCLTVILFDEAISRAKELDFHFAKTGQTVGPLHGLPVSLKDNFNIVGKPSSVGFCAWAEEPMQHESTVVGMLRDLGAVAYVKTNVPTAMMIAETVNNTYGRTFNPRNRALTSGGSSGGESALVAMCGSPLGIGTDIGGSLRIPAAMTGIFTIRPSYGRFPHFDARSGMAGQEAVGAVHGPMARSLADLKLFGKSIVDAKPWLKDPKCIPIPWREVELPAKPKIGVLWDDGMVSPTPPVKRALQETVTRLKGRGYEIVEWSSEGHAQAVSLIAKFFLADGGKSIRKAVEASGEPWRPEMKAYKEAKEIGVYDLWQLQQERTDFCKLYLDRWAANEDMHAILCPTTPYAAVKHGDFKHIGYTGVYNIVDSSAVSFPTGLYAQKDIDVVPGDFKALGDADEVAQREYDASAVHGMPISLQLVGKRLEEEKMLALTEKVLKDVARS